MDKAEFDRYAESYEQQHAKNIAITGEGPEYFFDYKVKDAMQICEKLNIKIDQILDFGAGIGGSTPYFKIYFPDSHVVAADISEKSLVFLEHRNRNVAETHVIRNNRINFPDGLFDLSFTACVFHHIPQDEHIYWLNEIRRVTRKEGVFVIFEHNPYNPLTVRAVNTCPFDANAVLIRAAEMKRRIADAGWKDIRCRYRVFFPKPLASLRPIELLLYLLPLGAQYCVIARRA